MPRAKSNILGRTEPEQQLAYDSLARREHNDCAVRAICVATGRPYAEVHIALEATGRKPKAGVSDWQILRALELLGFAYRGQPLKALLARYPGQHAQLRHVTSHHPERFPAAFAGMGPAVFFYRGHVAGFRDGVVHDWTRGQSRRCLKIYLVTPKEPS